MTRTSLAAVAAVLTLAAATPAVAQNEDRGQQTAYNSADVLDRLNLEVEPVRGQSATTQRADEEACVDQAASTLDTPVQVDDKTKIGALKGAGGGAAAGLLIGALTGSAVKGAVIGAGTGAVAGHLQKNRAQSREEKERQKAVAKLERETRRQITSCLSRRGYSVTQAS